MEDHLLQKLHDGLSQANSRRGRQGGLGGVAGQAVAKNTHIVFDEDGTTNKSSGLYANFVKGVTLTSSKEMTCSMTTAASSDEDEESEEDVSPAIAAAKPASKKRSKATLMKMSASDPTEGGETEEENSRQNRRKKQTKNYQTIQQEAAEAEPAVSPSSLLLGTTGLVRLELQGSKQSLQKHILSLLPRCRRFLLVGGCGFVDVLIHRDERGEIVRHKKLWAAHLHGTCDFQNDRARFLSLSGTFHFSHGGSERPQVISAAFGSGDLFAGGRGVCEVFGFPLDKKNKCLAN